MRVSLSRHIRTYSFNNKKSSKQLLFPSSLSTLPVKYSLHSYFTEKCVEGGEQQLLRTQSL